MIGFVIGTVCLIALVKTARRHGCGHGCGGYERGGSCGSGGGGDRCGGGGCCGDGGGGWRGHHRHGPWGGPGEHGPSFGEGRWMFRRMMLRRLFERLETTPGQEKVIVAAVDEAHEALHKSWGVLRDSRDEVARSISGEAFDESAMGNAFAKQDEAIAASRRAVMNALTKVHEALDAKQRAALADMIARGPGAWGRSGGPYRS